MTELARLFAELTRLFEAGLLIWFVLLLIVIGGRILNGDIDATGVLVHEHGEGVAPERVLAMAVFPVVLTSYFFNALHADMSVPHPSLPDISDQMVMLLTGGNGLYLAGKIAHRRTP